MIHLSFGRLVYIVCAVMAGIAVFSGAPLHGEYVFLKNGTVVECKILSETPSSMTVETPEGKTSVISRATVLRVMYTQLYRGKLYIQKVDGRVIEAYIIDEDQDNYTVRTELNSPHEFTIRRDEVLFMTRKNPSALAGRVSYKSVDLTWRGPYTPNNPVKIFKVYVRTKTGEFGVAGETSSTSFSVRGLQCNTEYFAMVTAVDKSGHESLPSNTVHVTTRKGKPSAPGDVRVTAVTSGSGGSCAAQVAWDRAVDPCGGVITEYGVYLKDLSSGGDDDGAGARFPGYRLAGKTAGSAFTIAGLKDAARYRVKVTSIDNTKDESAPGWARTFTTKNRLPVYPFPLSAFRGLDGRIKLAWRVAYDPDGAVTGYRIYRKTKGADVLMGSTEKTEFEVTGLPPAEKHCFTVRSVDNRGGESAESYPASTGLICYAAISAKAAFLAPVGHYGRLYSPGWGGTASVSGENLFLDSMALGVETGYYHFKGKSDKSLAASIVPFMAVLSYRFHFARWFSLDPAAAFGGCYNMTRVNSMDIVTPSLYSITRYRDRSFVDFMFSAGVNCIFTLQKMALLQVGVFYNGVVERGGVLSIISVNAGAGVRI